jgi:glycerol-3-phosphate O-acyltransferase/dihydroxyacetone phosphate acyltransferase
MHSLFSPVKIFMHVFPAVAPWHIASVCILLSIYIWISEFKALLYFSVKIFFHSIISIFFRDVEIIGRDKLPRHGPIIFTVNHANQFIDAVMALCTCQFQVSYLMAEASWHRPIVGDLAWALDVVPVKRAQDGAKKGTGTVVFSKQDYESTSLLSVQGTDTQFTQQLSKGDKIRPAGTATAVKITELVDDTVLLVDGSDISEEDLETIFSKTEPHAYDVIKRVDQKVVYEKVLDKLASGGCIGIFPEGGSHDRTDLLPLKVGVALIAYSALENDGLNIPIVPIGLNYFRSHRWRGRAVVEYGEPIYIDPSTLNAYKAGGPEKRSVCNELLDRIQDSMRSVIVSTPDYDSLQLIHTARRLYQRRGLQGKEKQDMTRRFATGYKMLTLMTNGDPPEA